MRDPVQRFDPAVLSSLHARFPREFVWGVATSAFQIEGAVAEDGRGPSIWDKFCSGPGNIADGSNADVACDHYHCLEKDLDLIASLGVDAYRFSISWPRVQPLGYGPWNRKGVDFYRRLISGLRQRNIQAHATLYHWDLPQALQDQGGWCSRQTCERFVEFASGILRQFGSDLTSVATFNEPWVVAVLGHEKGIFAPGLASRKASMTVAHHLLLAHGMTLQAVRDLGIKTPIGIVLNLSPVYPVTQSTADRARAFLDDGMLNRWYLDALLKGVYPEDILRHLGDDAPVIQSRDMELIGQSLDFLGVNYYTRSWAQEQSGNAAPPPGAPLTDMGWEVYPQGLTDLLLRMNRDYRLPPLYVTENGAAFADQPENGRIHDGARVHYFLTHWAAVADACAQGVDLRGYFVWSLFDNFEWASGLSKRFGIVHVDYATQKRTPKDSALLLKAFLHQRHTRMTRLPQESL